MKARLYKKTVLSCWDCGHSLNNGLFWYCPLCGKRELKNPDTIPDWCPLEDAEPEEVQE